MGANRSPPLGFVDVPTNAKSLALRVDDPDASRGTFTHLVAFNIDSNTSGFSGNQIPKDVRLACNDSGALCPL